VANEKALQIRKFKSDLINASFFKMVTLILKCWVIVFVMIGSQEIILRGKTMYLEVRNYLITWQTIVRSKIYLQKT